MLNKYNYTNNITFMFVYYIIICIFAPYYNISYEIGIRYYELQRYKYLHKK